MQKLHVLSNELSLQCPGHTLIVSTWINNRSNSTGYRAIRLQTLKK